MDVAWCVCVCVTNGRILAWRNPALSDLYFRTVYPKVAQKSGSVPGLEHMLPQVQHRVVASQTPPHSDDTGVC